MKKVLIAGLGNPGAEFEMFRHNIGARIVKAFIGTRKIDPQIKIYLPTTFFMNESGKALGPLLKKEKIMPRRLLVVHDDADIFFGKFKLSFGSRSAGHRGVESIIQALGTKDFWRLRIGIQPKGASRHIRAEELVLKPFSPEEEAELPNIIAGAFGAIEAWLDKI
jgi:PTH1 family peptidyl-tRNA hydrolase